MAHVMDNSGITHDFMGYWSCYGVYLWWVNSYSFGNCTCRDNSPVASRQKKINYLN